MTDGNWRRNGPRLILGLVVIGLGILFTLDKLGYVEAGSLWEYWPVLLIAAGLGRFLLPRGCHGRGSGVFLIALGALFLVSNLGLLPYDVWDLWPVLLVLLGISMVLRATGRSRRRASYPCCEGDGEPAPEGMGVPLASGTPEGGSSGAKPPATGGRTDVGSTVDCFALLGGSHRRSVSQDFRGGSMFAFMGGCELDLRQASIRSGEAVLDTFAMWGGIDLTGPPDWRIVVHGTPILGAFDDKTSHGGDGSKVLVVTGVAIMGGIDIKN